MAVDSRPGPETVITSEEKKLFQYILDMGDMGYGLTIEDVRTVAFEESTHSLKEKQDVTGMLDFAVVIHN